MKTDSGYLHSSSITFASVFVANSGGGGVCVCVCVCMCLFNIPAGTCVHPFADLVRHLGVLIIIGTFDMFR